jgi:thiol-disulfide isomerase/thioredoxin
MTPIVPKTLQEIDEDFDDREKEVLKAVRRLRYGSVLEYVAARPKSRDVEDARGELVRLALLTDDWRSAIERADEYLAMYPAGEHEVDARSAKADALAKQGRTAEAHAAYESLTRAVNAARHGQGAVVASWTAYARWLEKIGDLEGARGAWRGLKAATASTSSGANVAYVVEEQMKALDMIGREPAPLPADAKDLEGRGLSLSQYRGSVVLVDFWATWCSPCRAEMPEIQSAYERFHDKGFDVVGVAIDVASEGGRVRQFVTQSGIPWRTLHYPDLWRVKSVPYSVLIGRDGKVVRVGLRGRELVREIGRLVGAK